MKGLAKYLLENGKTIIYTGYYPYFVQGVDERTLVKKKYFPKRVCVSFRKYV